MNTIFGKRGLFITIKGVVREIRNLSYLVEEPEGSFH